MRRADEDVHHEVGLGRLDLADGRAELVDGQREELLAHHLAAGVLDRLLDPLGGDLAVIVVRGHDVDRLAPALHRLAREQVDIAARRGAGGEEVAVAHPAFVVGVVEVERLELVQDRPDDLARGAGQPALDHRHLVAQHHLPGVLVVGLHLRLGIVGLDLELLAENAAGGVDLVDGHLGAGPLVLPEELQIAGKIVDRAALDGVGGRCAPGPEIRPGGERRGARGGCLDERTTFDGHGLPSGSPAVRQRAERRPDWREMTVATRFPADKAALPAARLRRRSDAK